jgi:hypothetical protein
MRRRRASCSVWGRDVSSIADAMVGTGMNRAERVDLLEEITGTKENHVRSQGLASDIGAPNLTSEKTGMAMTLLCRVG